MSGPSTCVYCGEPSNTRDHVPPKLLYPKPRPSNLISVPSCATCNSGFSKDDEYIRIAVVLRSDLAKHPQAKGLFAPTIRGLNRPQQRGFAQTIVSTVKHVPVHTTEGIFLGHAPAMIVDLERLRRTVERIVRGLYFHTFGQRFTATLRVWAEEDIGGFDQVLRDELRTNILIPLYQTPQLSIGEDVFAYWKARDAEHPEASAWLLQFFGEVRFLALTGPANEDAP